MRAEKAFMAAPAAAISSRVSATWLAIKRRCVLRPRALPVCFELLPETPLCADTPHRFPVAAHRPATHVRLDIYPDGGMSRLRLLGRPDRAVLEETFRRHTDAL